MLLFSSILLPNTPILQSKIQIVFKTLNRFPLYRMIIGTAVFQLLMVGVVALKGSFAASCLVLPLPVVTVFFYLFILQHYIRPSANLSLKAAHSLEILLLTFCRWDVERERQTIVSFLDHYVFLTLNGCNLHILYFLNNMVTFHHFQMFILDFYCSY